MEGDIPPDFENTGIMVVQYTNRTIGKVPMPVEGARVSDGQGAIHAPLAQDLLQWEPL